MQFKFEDEEQDHPTAHLEQLHNAIKKGLVFQQTMNTRLKQQINSLQSFVKQNAQNATNCHSTGISASQPKVEISKTRKSKSKSKSRSKQRRDKNRRVKDIIMNKGFPSHPKDKKIANKTMNNSLKMPYRFSINK